MRQRIRESRQFWTYEYMAEYVTEKVAATAGDPLLDVYRANDTVCEAGNYTTVRDFTTYIQADTALEQALHWSEYGNLTRKCYFQTSRCIDKNVSALCL